MLFGKPPSVLGIDIGTTSIKVVELQKERGGVKLRNYGEFFSPERELLPVKTSFISFFEEEIADFLKKILKEAKIETKNAHFSLPLFSSFFTIINLPLMKPDEIPEAVKLQAHQYIPVPVEEVVLDWSIIEEEEALFENKIQVLLVAVPKDVINKYVRIARLLGLSLKTLEVESFSEARALVKEDKRPTLIIDIGGRTTNIIIVDKGFIRLCHNLDFSGFALTRTLSKRLGISLKRAAEFQKAKGLKKEIGGLVRSALLPAIDKMIFGVERAMNTYLAQHPKRKIERIILSGGTANMPGLCDYISSKFEIKTEIADPFKEIEFPSVLEEVIKEIGPSFSVAVGLALAEFEKKK
ncbi:type IV pilus assembly protein PilM [bacterium]|nr:type IV pilus assembly protein PilM [bacterium]